MNALFLLLCVFHTSAQCIQGLIAGFSMDELGGSVLRDSTATRQNITFVNTSSFGFSTFNNPQGLSSLVFAGNGELVLNPFVRPPQYTVTLWFQTTDTGEAALFSWIDAGGTYTYYARLVQGRVGVSLNTVLTTQLSQRAYNDGRWHFLVLSYTQDTQYINIIIDPHLQSIEQMALVPTGTPRVYSVFQIGGMRGRDLGFVGQMDDFRVYNTLLGLSDMQRIAFQLDTPCTASLLIPQRALYQSWIPPNTPTSLVLNAAATSVCGQRDVDGNCQNNRYGIAVTACAGNIAGFAMKVITGTTVTSRKDTVSSLGFCAVSFDGSRYVNSAGVEPARLCMSSPRVLTVNNPANPLVAAGGVNQVTFTAGRSRIFVEVSAIVADAYNSYNHQAKAFAYSNPVVNCNANYIEARWSTPVLNNGLTCNSCIYQAWYVPLSLIVADNVNLRAVCGVKLYGAPLPDTFSTPFYNQFVLPINVRVPGDTYLWVVLATSATDGVEGVVAVLDTCPAQSASRYPTPAPTFFPGTFTHDDINSNVLVLNLLAQDFPVGPPRDGFINQFTMSIATVLNTDVRRINVTSFTPLAANKVAVGFDIGLPISNSDNRTAGTLALLLWRQQKDRSSVLYTVLPNTNADPSSFTSNYEHIPVWTDNTNQVAPVPFPWQYIVAIVAACLGALCCCCLIYYCYHRTYGKHEKRPRHVTTHTATQSHTTTNLHTGNSTRSRGTEVDPHRTSSNTTVITNLKPTRFYDDDDKHTTASTDHINFPQMRSPTRGNDLATAKRLNSSPDTQSDYTQVSYKGTTLNSASDNGPAPHLDPREWKTVVALHGRNGTVDKGDLVFKLGDFIRVIGPCDGPHWFEGELESTGQRGMVPVNHVKGQVPSDEVRVHRT